MPLTGCKAIVTAFEQLAPYLQRLVNKLRERACRADTTCYQFRRKNIYSVVGRNYDSDCPYFVNRLCFIV